MSGLLAHDVYFFFCLVAGRIVYDMIVRHHHSIRIDICVQGISGLNRIIAGIYIYIYTYIHQLSNYNAYLHTQL